MIGSEWIVEAYGCDAAALRDSQTLTALFTDLVAQLSLTPVGVPVWHAFPAPGGVTGFVILSESHLACHTFPEFASICLNVFCCRPRPEVDLLPMLTHHLGATHATVRRVARAYADTARADA